MLLAVQDALGESCPWKLVEQLLVSIRLVH